LVLAFTMNAALRLGNGLFTLLFPEIGNPQDKTARGQTIIQGRGSLSQVIKKKLRTTRENVR